MPSINPSHRLTNRTRRAASVSLSFDSAFHHHYLASRRRRRCSPCTDDESFFEVISVFENVKEVLDWPFWAERGGVEGGVGLTDITVGEWSGKRSSCG